MVMTKAERELIQGQIHDRLRDLLNQDEILSVKISWLVEDRIKGTELEGLEQMTDAQLNHFIMIEDQVKAHLLALAIVELI